MFGFLKIKVLLFGVLLASPAVALWGFRSHKPLTIKPAIQAVADGRPSAGSVSRIPVEVIANGSAPQWVYVEVGNQAVPEPGMVSLLVLTTLLVRSAASGDDPLSPSVCSWLPGRRSVNPAMRLFDTLTRTERDLRPIDGSTFRFYCCGPTVYGPAHIGNFRTFVLQDVLRRTLETGGMRTLHVRNITDVDDKTIRDSQKAGQSLKAFTDGWTAKFHADCEKLGLLPPHIEPGAVDHIPQQIAMIATLVRKATPTCPTMARSISKSPRSQVMAVFLASTSASWTSEKPRTPAPARMNTKRTASPISCSGKAASLRTAIISGHPRGAKAARLAPGMLRHDPGIPRRLL